MISRHAFGSRLRTQRERRGVTLESIADSTKIKRSLLEALERGDASQWPRGLFRRAYLRDYACAIGLPAEPLVAEFVRLFPEDGSPVSDDDLAAAQEPMRLTFAVEPDTRVRRLAARPRRCWPSSAGWRVAGDIVSFATGWTLLTACGAVALVYYPIATALTGRVLSAVHLREHPEGAPGGNDRAAGRGGRAPNPRRCISYRVSRRQRPRHCRSWWASGPTNSRSRARAAR